MKPMKYSNPSVRDRGGGHWQARFRYKEGDKWRTLSRNLEATSKRDANKKATQLHRQLEEEAELAKFRVLLVMDEDEAVLERFLEKYISGIEGSGGVTSTSGGPHCALRVISSELPANDAAKVLSMILDRVVAQPQLIQSLMAVQPLLVSRPAIFHSISQRCPWGPTHTLSSASLWTGAPVLQTGPSIDSRPLEGRRRQ